jgi:hypothetical protein
MRLFIAFITSTEQWRNRIYGGRIRSKAAELAGFAMRRRLRLGRRREHQLMSEVTV